MDERTAFESYMTEGGTWPKAVVRGRDGQYLLAQTAAAWTVWQARAAAPTVVEPVAKVELMMTGGSAGLATRIVEIDDHLRDRLRPGQLLYTAPPRAALTDAQLLDILQSLDACTARLPGGFRLFARAVEQAHGIGGPRNE